MPNALGGPPPAPNIQPPPSDGNALTGAPGASQPPQQLPPPPSHHQTVAALRHFDAIERELMTLLKDPDCGKSDLKSQIIDGMTGLVRGGILTPIQAVTELGTLPERPFDQRKWLEVHLQQTMQHANVILAHHVIGAVQGAPVDDSASPPPTDHIATISGLTSRYKGQPNA